MPLPSPDEARARYHRLMTGWCPCGGYLRRIAPQVVHPALKPDRQAYRCQDCGECYTWHLNAGPKVPEEINL